MQVTIFGATGMVGRHLIIHAMARGWRVVAFGRQVEALIDRGLQQDLLVPVKGYVFDSSDVKKALKGSDAVLSALGGSIDGTDNTRSLGMKNIVSQMERYGPKRIVALGGLGVLDSPDGKGPLFMQDDYPQAYVAVGKEHYAAYQYLKASSLNWTFVCSPNILNAEATGRFTTVTEAPATSFEINAGDLALYMVQAVADGLHLKQRVGIGNKED
jgi:putative NADH-flavin reductase